MKKDVLISSVFFAATAGLVHAATIFASGDSIVGGQLNGANFEIGVIGTAQPNVNNWPAGELPDFTIDGVGQKYLNFGEENTGIVVTPAAGSSIATSIKLWTANDAEERDPASYSVYGTNIALGAGPSYAVADFALISTGDLALPASRNLGGASALDDANSQTVGFANADAYTSYMIVFPTLKDAGAANSMQIAEIQLDGTIVPEPGSASLLALGLGVFFFRRKR